MRYAIRMENCGFFARHGVFQEEEVLGQRFYVDVVLQLEVGDALETDSLSGTVDYGEAYDLIAQVVLGERRYLIESIALTAAKTLVERFDAVIGAEVTIRKPNAPVRGVLDFVEVKVAWPQ
ncbi:dihydroneopterin aldolase [Notoacmeibacter ruber]|uniref:7,8-dihydroneopterin aldolase n=1 Tax=Notoacmeibacter ruber TaxID=2670375 RepID=A0A3L7JB86_9HYPH|nr:dihydroneopterin aldolase [Notoacmeibacter ruber]RLQ87699.1 dihydroneopterin aldolase [Notoacmeibacter ruber]